jgi:pimeloyl-ACP methyl ester carboxylesterase
LPKPGLSVRVLEVGEGEPVLFVHGGGGVASAWTPLMAGWRAGRVIAIDRPGHGLSERFDYRGIDLRRHAVDVLEGVLDALGHDRVKVVANSMGGLWSFWLALDRPARVDRLVQLGCPALMLDTGAPLPLRLMSKPWLGRLLTRLEPPGDKSSRKLFARMGHDPATLPAELFELVSAASRLPAFQEAWFSLLGRALTLRGPRISLTEDELRRVTASVLFLWGGNDPFGGVEVGRRACTLLPQGSLEVIGTGHLPWLDAPEACRAAAERFLAPERQRAAEPAPPTLAT